MRASPFPYILYLYLYFPRFKPTASPTPATRRQRVATVAAAAAQASPPHTAASRGDVASGAGSIGSEHVQQFYIVPRTGVFTTHTRLTTGLRLQRRPELDGDLERELLQCF